MEAARYKPDVGYTTPSNTLKVCVFIFLLLCIYCFPPRKSPIYKDVGRNTGLNTTLLTQDESCSRTSIHMSVYKNKKRRFYLTYLIHS